MAKPVSSMLLLFAVRLVQPGRLGDIAEGMQRLSPTDENFLLQKERISELLQSLRDAKLICMYKGQRYLLTDSGRSAVESSGIKLKVDERRMYLLKEARRAMRSERSSARDRSLQQ